MRKFKYKIGTVVTIVEPYKLEEHLGITTDLPKDIRHSIAYDKFQISGYSDKKYMEYYHIVPITGDIRLINYRSGKCFFSQVYIVPVDKLIVNSVDNWKVFIKRRDKKCLKTT